MYTHFKRCYLCIPVRNDNYIDIESISNRYRNHQIDIELTSSSSKTFTQLTNEFGSKNFIIKLFTHEVQ